MKTGEKTFYSSHFRLGILGGGQLGRMLIQEAVNFDIRTAVLDPSAEAPCASLTDRFVLGDFNDEENVYSFGKECDVITIEIEHVNVRALERLASEGKQIYPSPAILRIVHDKGLQKEFYKHHSIPTAPFHLVSGRSEALAHLSSGPFMQKLRTGGYDGKGVQAIRSEADASLLLDAPSVLESWVDLACEISVIVARNDAGEVRTFPIVELQFNPEANLVEFLFSPADVSAHVEAQALKIARDIVEAFEFVGLLAVELFVTHAGEVLVNEIAPRPHNSGHHTIEANVTSQYEQHLRSILSMPLGATDLIRPSVMINLLGETGVSGPVKYVGLEEALRQPGVHVHLYGKAETRPYRKMGHITVCADTAEEAKKIASQLHKSIRVTA